MKFYTTRSRGNLDITEFFKDQLWNQFALQFAAPTVLIDNCLGSPYYRSMYGPEMPKTAIAYLRKFGVARAVAVNRRRMIRTPAHVQAVPVLHCTVFMNARHRERLQMRMWRWLLRARAARNAARADAWRATVRDLMQRIDGLTHDNVHMIVEHVTHAPEEPEDSEEF
jgi:hypothetical protein